MSESEKSGSGEGQGEGGRAAGAISSGTTAGGIPKAVFVVSEWSGITSGTQSNPSSPPTQDDVDAFMKEHTSAEAVIKQFDELYRKYKFMEANLTQKKKRYDVSTPVLHNLVSGIHGLGYPAPRYY
jgi:hypothetical protein